MSITPYLKNSHGFDPETKRALGRALELLCIVLRTGDGDDHVKQAMADQLIALAKTGERDPEVLCDKALAAICRPEHDKPRTPAVGKYPVSLASSAVPLSSGLPGIPAVDHQKFGR
jgi:hypothetical protein